MREEEGGRGREGREERREERRGRGEEGKRRGGRDVKALLVSL